MKRDEKLKIAKANMQKVEHVPGPDPRVKDFIARRAQHSTQLRYWAKLGHALPRARKFFKVLLSRT